MRNILLAVLLLAACGPSDEGIIGKYCDFQSECNMIPGGFCNGHGYCTKYCKGDGDCPPDAKCEMVFTRAICKPR
jgi:hypothetical protein